MAALADSAQAALVAETVPRAARWRRHGWPWRRYQELTDLSPLLLHEFWIEKGMGRKGMDLGKLGTGGGGHRDIVCA
jgi:hypothetical protein